MSLKNDHVDNALPQNFKQAIILVKYFELDGCFLGPADFHVLGGFPAPAKWIPDEVLEFIDFGPDA